MVQYDFTGRKNCHILYSVMFYKKYDAIFTCGTPIMSCTTVHPTQEIHTWKKITSHSPHHNVQVDIYKDPGALPPNTEATHRRDKCQNDVQKYFSLQEWERSAVVRFIMQIENYTSSIKIKVHLNIQKARERKEKNCRSYVFFNSDNSLKNISFFFLLLRSF